MPVTITHSTLADGTFSATGAAAWDATHTVSGLGTMAEQNANNVNITGGSITGVTGVLSSLTVNSTPTSGGAAGQIMFDTGSVLQESSNLLWNNANGGLTVSSIANPTISSLTINGASNYTGATLSGVQITGTGGQFSCNATTLAVGEFVTISGTLGGTGSITGYANPTTYRISATNGTTTFTLVNATTGAAIVTTAGTPTGLTYTVTDPFINLSQTWNNSNVAFRGLQYNVTDTASNASSLLMDLQVGGASVVNVTKSGGITLTANSANGTVPAVRFNGNNWISYINNNYIGFTTNNILQAWFGAGSQAGLIFSSGGAVRWSSGTFGNALDLFLTRRGAANLRFGEADAAAPVAQTLSVQSVVAGTSNTAGANLTITGSQGTGTGAGGSIIFQVAPAGSSGTAQNALATALTIDSARLATFAAGAVFNGNVTVGTAGLSFGNVSGGRFTVGYFSATVATAAFQTYVGATNTLGSQIKSNADSVLRLVNAADADFNRLQFGGTTSSFPALKRSTTILQVRLADDSAYAPVEASTVRTATAYTVATLPAAGTAGRRAYVTDATAPTFLGALIGGGTVVCPVFDDGTAWVAG